jgi:pimeloyl-ACP methyl ester carboxylesterase
MILIHAGVADLRMWRAQINPFRQSYTVIYYDARGFGKSRTENTTFSDRQDIVDLMDRLGVAKAVILGISRGGQIAVDFTIEHPERVLALVAIAAGVSGYRHQPDDSTRARHEDALFAQMEKLWDKKDFNALEALEVHVWADGPAQLEGRASQALRQFLLEMIHDNNNRQDGEATSQPLEPPAVGRLQSIDVPALVLYGDLDTIGTIKMGDFLAREISGSRKVVFPGAAHMIPMEQPESFNRVVLEFLRVVGLEEDGKFQCIHPDPGKTGPRIDARRYRLIRHALLQIIPADNKGIPFRTLADQVTTRLTAEQLAFLGAVGWYTTTVKLDLEARGWIERLPGVKPQRLRRVT